MKKGVVDKCLSYPFSAELNLCLSDDLINEYIKDNVKLKRIISLEVHSKEDCIDIFAQIGLNKLISKSLRVEIEYLGFKSEDLEAIMIFRIRKPSIPSVLSLLGGVKFSYIAIDGDILKIDFLKIPIKNLDRQLLESITKKSDIQLTFTTDFVHLSFVLSSIK